MRDERREEGKETLRGLEWTGKCDEGRRGFEGGGKGEEGRNGEAEVKRRILLNVRENGGNKV